MVQPTRGVSLRQSGSGSMLAVTNKQTQGYYAPPVQSFVEAHFHFHFTPRYIDTDANHLADDLSRNHVLSFLSKVPMRLIHRNPCRGLW